MRTVFTLSYVLGAMCCATQIFAEDQRLLATVRELGKESMQDYDEGRCQQAAEKSLKAYEVVRVPTLVGVAIEPNQLGIGGLYDATSRW